MPPGIVGTSFLFCVSARLLGRRQHKRNLWSWNTTSPKVGRDRVGNYSDRHRLGRPAGAALLTRGSAFEGGRIRSIPASSVACATCWKRHIACKLPHEEHQFSATISETRFSHRRRPARIYRSRGGGCGGWNVPTAAGSMTREAALPRFNSVGANVSTIYRISFACTQGRIETE
jgi:hypothetical protein